MNLNQFIKKVGRRSSHDPFHQNSCQKTAEKVKSNQNHQLLYSVSCLLYFVYFGQTLDIWQFSKKIRNKTFYFYTKKNHFILFLLSFGPKVHFRGQKLTFWSNHPEYNFQSKTVKLSYFTLEKSFFSCITNFFPLILKLATVAKGHQKQ
jgi:hypothetical protein